MPKYKIIVGPCDTWCSLGDIPHPVYILKLPYLEVRIGVPEDGVLNMSLVYTARVFIAGLRAISHAWLPRERKL